MYHLSMKLSDMFDPNPMHTSDKIVAKRISVKETPFKLDLEPHSLTIKIIAKKPKLMQKIT